MSSKESLHRVIRDKIGDELFVVVSNREPYIHTIREGKLRVEKPASGLVTALDPTLRASKGIWVAQSTGNADRKVVDKFGRVKVPPGEKSYTLKRVWITKEEEEGFYYGISNGALWPLCHITFARPKFSERDWEIYRRVNQKFADAVLEEIEGRKALVWIQDFHLSLLPAMLKAKRPDILVAHFWHIPWPNPEVFRIYPWIEEMMEGMLGNDLIGFHIRLHCDNFMNTVDQTLETRIDRERSVIFHHGGVETKVLPFPISVDEKMISVDSEKDYSDNEIVQDIYSALPEKVKHIAVGVDRIDYTKGIPERLMAVDRFLAKHPEMIGKFVYLQMGTLSRIHIPLYKRLNDELNQLVDEINWRYSTPTWQPIIFLRRNLTYPEILAVYRIADSCIVSSLHDGMNLVAKEFVASRNDEDGVLLLSRFTGAARELEKYAIIFNPYDVEGFSEAIAKAVSMPRHKRVKRMKALREIVSQNNIYRWAESFVSELARLV